MCEVRKDETVGDLAGYISLDEVAMALAKMRMRRTVRNAGEEFVRRYMSVGGASENKSPACAFLPPRRQWVRQGPCARRRKSSAQLQVGAIMRCVRACERNGSLEKTEWGRRLIGLVENLQGQVARQEFTVVPPRSAKVPKLSVDGTRGEREISVFDDPATAVLISRTGAYLRDWFEPVLKRGRCCYSFRKNPKISHQSAVRDLCAWRKAHVDASAFVAECDIRKFFDNIRHDVVEESIRHYIAELGAPDSSAMGVVCAYLACYCKDESDGIRRGIPQGGALSPTLANIVMARADDTVLAAVQRNAFYARYCDDMVIASVDEGVCHCAMEAYLGALDALGLPPHPMTEFAYGLEYFEAKSKGPFRWDWAKAGERNVAPWVSFLGNQVRCDGEVRVRGDTVAKHVLKLKKETGETINRLANEGVSLRAGMNPRKFYTAFMRRIVAKGVGYMRSGTIPSDGLCWAAAFPNMTKNAACARQMRMLDRVRSRCLGALRRVLGLKGAVVRFAGRPYSYFGYLMKMMRPARGPRRTPMVVRLPYSEL